ncbi:MAG: ATP-dependent DNA helicase RecG, partial [Candidatus Paceibacterota bacterium]
VRNLLYHFPARYEHVGETKRVEATTADELVTLYGTITKLKTRKAWKSKIPMAEGVFSDQTGSVNLVWFNQPYIAKMIQEGATVEVEGKITERSGKKTMQNPRIEPIEELPSLDGELPLAATENEHTLNPVYSTSKGATSFYLSHLIKRALSSDALSQLEDPIPKEVLERYNLPNLKTALIWIHAPKKLENAEAARKRMAFEEIFAIQIDRQRERAKLQELKAFSIQKTRADIEGAITHFGFQLTNAQESSIATVLQDLEKEVPMSRLLEGDVGSGKTVVAAAAMYATATSFPRGQDFGSLQCAYMVPTEILAEQQFQSFCNLFRHTNLQVGLITGSGCKKFPSKISPDGATPISRAQLLKWVKNGEIAVVIGTHSLIQKTVEFKHLALVVIDEQHRFGTNQRKKLLRKDEQVPHLLSMTATPIPRTLALTIYGDLDLTIIDEMPKGRKRIVTEIVPPNKRENTYEKVREEIQAGRQAYVLCPRIDDPDPSMARAVTAKSVTEESKRLREKIFPEYEIGELHGKMTPKKKDEVMRDFASGDIDILVTTSVVEVGVNVPNATVIIIEGAERFGLAQLHQLRGRVVRSNHQAYCFVFTDSGSDKTFKRLSALKDAKNGFELAEYDLELRGAGDLYGRKQSGISDIGMDAIKNIKMVEAARTEAQKIIQEDSELKKYPLLEKRVRSLVALHME